MHRWRQSYSRRQWPALQPVRAGYRSDGYAWGVRGDDARRSAL